ncbi:hypothetical protein FSP39_010378 [Pinctada imbricata]|uniref:G-protein coupled receptors family 1 profile domain-containing protein n=1 Tax=Pinctada imbricata TaxID=66713 RepID=A0AA88Y8V0_PINIB|nr:hypothetical protein FSP39_010378 [Pinctada imbricata]
MSEVSNTSINETYLQNGSHLDLPKDDYQVVIVILSRLQKYTNPVFCILGLLGNVIAATVFLSNSQRKTSCSLYLAARSVSDSGFLIALFVVWLSDIGIPAFNYDVICQLIIFLTYFCGFLSVWFVVALTTENFVRICHPFSVNKYCTTKIAKIVIFAFVVIALALYNFPLWTNKVVNNNGTMVCSRIPKYDVVQQALNYTDTLLTLVIPISIIICLMVTITVNVIQTYHRQRRLKGNRRDNKSKNPQGQVTKMLFSVSLIFIVLNLPSHAIRVYSTVSQLVFGMTEVSVLERSMHFAFYTLYYMNFAVNILLYLVFGPKFREEFMRIFLRRSKQRNELTMMGSEKRTLLESPEQVTHL